MISRQTGKITVFLREIRIEGTIFTMSEYRRGRLSDALNRGKEKFLSVTDATVYECENDEPIAREKLLFINKDHILYVKPAPSQEKKE
jgi:hypothetical protein